MARNRSRAESCRNPASIQLTHDPVTPTCHMRLPLSKFDVSRHAGTAFPRFSTVLGKRGNERNEI
jgi:hypothetical protein